jgi:carboxylate-amine ligase
MNKLSFSSSGAPTLGVEIELALVNAETSALSSSIHDVLARLPDQMTTHVKPELMQCYLEINTDVCNSVGDAEKDLRGKIIAVEKVCDELNLKLFWTGTHPFSLWRDQNIVQTERYKMLLGLLQDTARQLITFGLHVHVGVDSGDKAVMLCDRLMQHLPTLLALSANSPFWENRATGLHSNRSKVMESLPTAGLPSLMRNWSEYTWLVNHLVETGFINTIREIWWDVRPHHNFGTVEIRICDMPGHLDDALALVALIQCLVATLSEEIDEGTYQHDSHPMMVRQNKWRACRYGLDAQLVDSYTYEVKSARERVLALTDWLSPVAQHLHCEEYLAHAKEMAQRPSWSDRQLQIWKEAGAPQEVVQRLSTQSKLSVGM